MRSRHWWSLTLVLLVTSLVVGSCTPLPPDGTLPTYDVTSGSVVTPAAAAALAEALGIPDDDLLEEDGSLRYLDVEHFLAVPMLPVVTALQSGDDGDEPQPTLFEAFDFEAIAALQPIGEARALALAAAALAAADLTPNDVGLSTLAATPGVSYASFEAVSVASQIVATAQLDGQVAYGLRLDGRRLAGPGAVVQISFDAAETPTQVAYALRGLQRGGTVPVVSSQRAADHAAALYLAANPSVSPLQVDYVCEEVVYYAPPLALDSVTKLFPHYDCAGTAQVGAQQAEPVQLLQYFVPAVEDVPVATVTATIREGAQSLLLDYQVTVAGGTAPYTITVGSGTTDYLEQVVVDATTSGSYAVYPYSFKTEDPFDSEKVLVSVTDANGLLGMPVVLDRPFPAAPFTVRTAPVVTSAAGLDVGVTRGVCDLGAGIQSGFGVRMALDGIPLRFNYACQSSWEKDFRENGLDYQVIDNVDLALYIGHGWPGGFTFDNATKDDGALRYDEAAGAVRWGNQDLEWLALVSCQVLARDAPGGGGLWHQRWGQEFDGLHMILGFHTNAYDWSGFGGRFADWMMGRKIGFVTMPPLPIRAAWFQATKEQQPSGVVAAVMGVYGQGGLTSYNDYFHGKGPVSPDLRGTAIAGWWYVRGP
jgi:hypothetical protein